MSVFSTDNSRKLTRPIIECETSISLAKGQLFHALLILKYLSSVSLVSVTATYTCIIHIIYIDKLFVGSYVDNEGDYVYQNSSFTFNSTSDEYSVIIRPVDDNIVEPDENFTLTISRVANRDFYRFENQVVTVTIYNDDCKFTRVVRNRTIHIRTYIRN